MINRDSRGHPYSVARGEILRFSEDELLRKHLPRMFSLIRNESWGIEDDRTWDFNPNTSVIFYILQMVFGRQKSGSISLASPSGRHRRIAGTP
jgi:hypothetical protein